MLPFATPSPFRFRSVPSAKHHCNSENLPRTTHPDNKTIAAEQHETCSVSRPSKRPNNGSQGLIKAEAHGSRKFRRSGLSRLGFGNNLARCQNFASDLGMPSSAMDFVVRRDKDVSKIVKSKSITDTNVEQGQIGEGKAAKAWGRNRKMADADTTGRWGSEQTGNRTQTEEENEMTKIDRHNHKLMLYRHDFFKEFDSKQHYQNNMPSSKRRRLLFESDPKIDSVSLQAEHIYNSSAVTSNNFTVASTWSQNDTQRTRRDYQLVTPKEQVPRFQIAPSFSIIPTVSSRLFTSPYPSTEKGTLTTTTTTTITATTNHHPRFVLPPSTGSKSDALTLAGPMPALLLDAFSPHRHKERFVPRGWAAQMRAWVVETSILGIDQDGNGGMTAAGMGTGVETSSPAPWADLSVHGVFQGQTHVTFAVDQCGSSGKGGVISGAKTSECMDMMAFRATLLPPLLARQSGPLVGETHPQEWIGSVSSIVLAGNGKNTTPSVRGWDMVPAWDANEPCDRGTVCVKVTMPAWNVEFGHQVYADREHDKYVLPPAIHGTRWLICPIWSVL